jgi:RNA 2',3'-cyclic 3'-phosphodiesterase
MAIKTHTTAVVIIPPIDLWLPIQAIRQQHDRHVRRWMPHITLIYPCRPRQEFAALAERFSVFGQAIQPFRIDLEEIRVFRHRRESYTLWLAPEPKEPLVQLQATLASMVPDCDDVTRHHDAFTPHLTLGQVQGQGEMPKLQQALQANWRPMSFTVCEVSLIWRSDPPDDVFRVGQAARLTALQQGNSEGPVK